MQNLRKEAVNPSAAEAAAEDEGPDDFALVEDIFRRTLCAKDAYPSAQGDCAALKWQTWKAVAQELFSHVKLVLRDFRAQYRPAEQLAQTAEDFRVERERLRMQVLKATRKTSRG